MYNWYNICVYIIDRRVCACTNNSNYMCTDTFYVVCN